MHIMGVVPLGVKNTHEVLVESYAQAAIQDAWHYAREILIVVGLNIALEAIVQEIAYWIENLFLYVQAIIIQL